LRYIPGTNEYDFYHGAKIVIFGEKDKRGVLSGEMGDGSWEMGDGLWEMGDGSWELGVGSVQCGVSSFKFQVSGFRFSFASGQAYLFYFNIRCS
jgi:hypothetical protein